MQSQIVCSTLANFTQKTVTTFDLTEIEIQKCPEHISASESKITNLPQKEQSKCMASMFEEHISSPEVVSDSLVSSLTPEICSELHRSNDHRQQTLNVLQWCIELQADHIVMPLHDIHIGDSETLLKQVPPCSRSAQSLNTVPIMCLTYSANNPPNINTVNGSGMLVGQNLPGG